MYGKIYYAIGMVAFAMLKVTKLAFTMPNGCNDYKTINFPRNKFKKNVYDNIKTDWKENSNRWNWIISEEKRASFSLI